MLELVQSFIQYFSIILLQACSLFPSREMPAAILSRILVFPFVIQNCEA